MQQVGLQNQARVQEFVTRGTRNKQSKEEDSRTLAVRGEIKNQISDLIRSMKQNVADGNTHTTKENSRAIKSIHTAISRLVAPQKTASGEFQKILTGKVRTYSMILI